MNPTPPPSLVHCPAWSSIPGLFHGTTLRQHLPGLGKIHVFDRLQELRRAGLIPSWPTVSGDQTHEDRIMVVRRDRTLDRHGREIGSQRHPELAAVEYDRTDALFTREPGLLLCLRTADCLPVFLLDRKAGAIGLAHCGWRGVRQDLAAKLVQVFVEQGSPAKDLEAWLGPCISAENYEVGPELAREFAEAFPKAPPPPQGCRLDLRATTRWQLQDAGLQDGNLHLSPDCTYGLADRYHSYRRDGQAAGRLLSFIGLHPETKSP